MNKNQYANIGMNRTAEAFLDANIEIIKKRPAFAKFYEGLKINNQSIRSTASRLVLNKGGINDTKASMRLMVEDQTVTMAAVVASIAQEKGDLEMYKRVKCTSSTFTNIRDEKLLIFARNVVTDANSVAAEMDDYSVTAEDIKSYETLVEDFAIIIAAPELASRANKTSGETLTALFRQNRSIHKKMKALARLFKKEYPEFYAGYLNCLTLRDPKTHHSQSAGIITDKATGKPLRGVIVKTEGAAWITTSNRNGKYKLVIPEAGFYTIIFEKEGYQPIRITEAEIRVGRTLDLEVVMIPL